MTGPPSHPRGAAAPDPPPAASDLPPGDETRSAWRWIRAASILAAIWLSYQLLLIVQGWISAILSVALYLVFGAMAALLAAPAVDWFERRARFPRPLAIIVVLVAGVAVVSGLIAAVAGPIASQAPRFLDRADASLQVLRTALADRGIDIGRVDVSAAVHAELSSRFPSFLLIGVTGTITALIDTLIVLVVAFWLLKDGTALRAGFIGLLPGRIRSEMDFVLDAVAVVIGGYVRAQLVMALILGVMAGLGGALIGVPFPLVVAVAVGTFELVPLVGPFLGGAVALLLSLTVGTWLVVETLALFVVIHVVEAYVIAPRVQARFIRLHPLVALLALLAGIEVGGFLGALFSVPTASLAAVFLRAAIGDVRANRPDLFAAQREDRYLQRRRRSILREFRFLRRGK